VQKAAAGSLPKQSLKKSPIPSNEAGTHGKQPAEIKEHQNREGDGRKCLVQKQTARGFQLLAEALPPHPDYCQSGNEKEGAEERKAFAHQGNENLHSWQHLPEVRKGKSMKTKTLEEQGTKGRTYLQVVYRTKEFRPVNIRVRKEGGVAERSGKRQYS